MKNKLTNIIEDYNMISDGDNICVALSGGADSVALFYYLVSNKQIFNIKNLYACHLNHMLRAEESDADEDFVKKLCLSYKIECFTKSVDINVICENSDKSIEEAARNARYDFFSEISKQYNCKIATAHTLSDCMETTIFNLSRGTGLKGMCGISPKRDYIIRPLIRCSRKEIENYCLENELSFVTDSTNETDLYTRNRIRHHIIPQLYKINPALETSFARFYYQVEEEEDYLESETTKAKNEIYDNGKYNRELYLKFHKAIGNRVLSKILAENQIEICSAKIERLNNYILSGEGVLQLNDDMYLKVNDNYFTIAQKDIILPYYEIKLPTLEFDKTTKISLPHGKNITVTLKQCEQNKNFIKSHNKDLKNQLDYDKINGIVLIRQKKDGDKITLANRDCTKSLKKLFNEMKISPADRGFYTLLSDEQGVIWLEDVGASKIVALNENTTKILTITMEV